jgi:hypothetical protein
MSQNTFEKVKQTSKAMYGSRKIAVCGYSDAEQQFILNLLDKIKLNDLPVVFITREQSDITLEDIFKLPDKSGIGNASDLQRTVIMSGLTEKELHTIITAYRAMKLPEQLWATLTPVSEKWRVGDLLQELAAEHQAMKSQREG